MNKLYNIIALFFFLFTCPDFLPQQNNFMDSMEKKSQNLPVHNIYNEIEEGISSGNISAITQYLSPQTYFSLSNGKSGYYSSNQAYYVLEDFFNIYRVISFNFQNISADENNPYATGVYSYDFKGKRNTAQVFISLKKTGNSWKITQLTVN